VANKKTQKNGQRKTTEAPLRSDGKAGRNGRKGRKREKLSSRNRTKEERAGKYVSRNGEGRMLKAETKKKKLE